MLLDVMRFSTMANNVIAGWAVTYVWSTREHAPATIIGLSRHGDNYIHLKYMRNGKPPVVFRDWGMILRTRCTSQRMLWMISLCQRKGSPNVCLSLPQNLHQSQLRKASMSNLSRSGVGLERASIPRHLIPRQ